MVIDKSMNNRVKEVRMSMGVSQAKFADKIGFSQGGIKGIELGKCNVSDRVILSMQKELGVSEEWLRTGNGTMYAQPEANTKSVIEQALDLLDKQYNMDKYEKAMMKSYFEMTPAARQGFQTFLKEIAPALAAEADEKKVAESAAEYNARRIPDKEDFIRQVELETATRGKLSVSPVDDGKNVV